MAQDVPPHYGCVVDEPSYRGHECEACRKKHGLRGWVGSIENMGKKWVNYAYPPPLVFLPLSQNVFTDVQRSGQCPTVV